jgi:hypothetical protein
MYISLRESRKNGFKQWSDSRQPTHGRVWDAGEGHGIVVPGSAVTNPGMTVPARPLHLSLLTAEKSL